VKFAADGGRSEDDFSPAVFAVKEVAKYEPLLTSSHLLVNFVADGGRSEDIPLVDGV
jgi:hypothetical protein